MGTFSINPGGVKTSAIQLQNAGQKLQSFSPQIDNVGDELSTLSGMGDIVSTVRMLASKVQMEGGKISELGVALTQITELYLNAENSVLGNMQNTGGGYNSEGYNSEASSAVMVADGGSAPRDNDTLMNRDPAVMDKYIAEFEKEHPDIAAEFDRIFTSGSDLGNITPDDIRRMKYLAYTSREPYRTIFIQNLAMVTVNDWESHPLDDKGNEIKSKDQAFYSPSTGKIDYGYPSCFGGDKRGQYTTFFHEIGHAIDHQIDPAAGSSTTDFTYNSTELGEGTTITDAIMYDVYENPHNPHSVTSMIEDINRTANPPYTTEDIRSVMYAMKHNGDTYGLSIDQQALMAQVQKKFISSIPQTDYPNYESVTDVYGGVTGNTCRTKSYYGHSLDYWSDTTHPAKELWAEYFSYNMAGDTKNLEHLKQYYPEAYKALTEYANYVYKETNGGT